MKVAALYVDVARGPYSGMPDVDPWGVERDARKYVGILPVVAHPPCGHWGRLAWSCKQPIEEKAMGLRAVAQVRAWGGVLEHPEASGLWRACGLPRPGAGPDLHGGVSISVDQVHWGHAARKRTWLYCVGLTECLLRETLDRHADYSLQPTRAMGVPYSKGRTLLCLPKTQRHLTPQPFAAALVDVARQCCGWTGRLEDLCGLAH